MVRTLSIINCLVRFTVVAALVALSASCHSEYELWLVNATGRQILLTAPQELKVPNGNSVLLADSQGRGIPLAGTLKLQLDNDLRCYDLRDIRVGGYGEYNNSGTLVVRLRLDRDERLYAIRVDGRKVAMSDTAGSQPSGYPIVSNCSG